jgi:dTMP kinase
MSEASIPTPGVFIVIDGVDGSGKTTILREFKKRLETLGRPVKQFRAIGEGDFGSKIREIVLNFKEERPVPASELLAFISAINQCYAAHVVPWVQQGGIAVADRWLYSTSVYQGIAAKTAAKNEGIAFERVRSLLNLLPAPDMSVILDIEQIGALSNLLGRNNGEKLNSLDAFCSDNIDEMVERYRDLRTVFPTHKFYYLNNNPPYPVPQQDQDLEVLVSRVEALLKE